MIQEIATVVTNEPVARDTFVLSLRSSRIAPLVLPGQFVNIKAWSTSDPLLRRPFSVYMVDREMISIVFNTIGKGTRILSLLRPGESVDVLGPLGRPFTYDDAGFDTAILVGGGLGVAPFPILTTALRKSRKRIVTLLGARSKDHLVTQHLENLRTATDDDSDGFAGTVVDLARTTISKGGLGRTKIFGCGPTPMLKALSRMTGEMDLLCEVSLEGPMGCGFGICQGCPVRTANGEKEYVLMCREGPVFSTDEIVL